MVKENLDVVNVKENANLIKGIVSFETNIELDDNVIGILVPAESNEDKVILNPLYTGGKLTVKMKIVGNVPTRFNVGDKIATLLILDSHGKKQEQE